MRLKACLLLVFAYVLRECVFALHVTISATNGQYTKDFHSVRWTNHCTELIKYSSHDCLNTVGEIVLLDSTHYLKLLCDYTSDEWRHLQSKVGGKIVFLQNMLWQGQFCSYEKQYQTLQDAGAIGLVSVDHQLGDATFLCATSTPNYFGDSVSQQEVAGSFTNQTDKLNSTTAQRTGYIPFLSVDYSLLAWIGNNWHDTTTNVTVSLECDATPESVLNRFTTQTLILNFAGACCIISGLACMCLTRTIQSNSQEVGMVGNLCDILWHRPYSSSRTRIWCLLLESFVNVALGVMMLLGLSVMGSPTVLHVSNVDVLSLQRYFGTLLVECSTAVTILSTGVWDTIGATQSSPSPPRQRTFSSLRNQALKITPASSALNTSQTTKAQGAQVVRAALVALAVAVFVPQVLLLCTSFTYNGIPVWFSYLYAASLGCLTSIVHFTSVARVTGKLYDIGMRKATECDTTHRSNKDHPGKSELRYLQDDSEGTRQASKMAPILSLLNLTTGASPLEGGDSDQPRITSLQLSVEFHRWNIAHLVTSWIFITSMVSLPLYGTGNTQLATAVLSRLGMSISKSGLLVRRFTSRTNSGNSAPWRNLFQRAKVSDNSNQMDGFNVPDVSTCKSVFSSTALGVR